MSAATSAASAAWLGVLLVSIFRLAGYFQEPRLSDAEIHPITGEPARIAAAPVHPVSTRAVPALTIVSWNIERGVQYARILTTLRTLHPDVVLLQEADRFCDRSGQRDVARDLAEALGMNWVSAGEFQE